jgi:hypothetical protein
MPELLFDELNPLSEQATKEYVASWSYGLWHNGEERTLPRSIDENTEYLQVDLYDKMLLDAQVKASINLLIYGILGGGLEVYPASESSADREVADFVKNALLEEIEETPLLTEVLPDMLSAMALGNKICEIVWNTPVESNLRIKGLKAWTIKRLKVKAREEVGFYVDVHKNVIGIVGRTRINQPLPPNTFRPINAYGNNEIVFPLEYWRDHFAWLSWKPRDSDPRGTSDLRSAYDAWWFKQQVKPEYLKYLATSSTGSIWVEMAPNAERRNRVKADGTIDTTAVIDPAEKVVAEVIKFQNTSVMAVANGTKLNPIQPTSNDGMPFKLALDIFNEEIIKAITGQVAATEKGAGAGRAPVIGQEIMNMPVTYGRMVAQNFIRRFLAKPLVRRNYSRLVAVPRIILPGLNKDDFLTSASGVSKLLMTNMIPPQMWNKLFTETGLGALNDETYKKMEELHWKTLENTAAAPMLKAQNSGSSENA